jgi:Zn-dependent protease with chaperone function
MMVLLGFTALLVCPIRMYLLRARWTAYAPRSAIVLWQAIGAAAGIAIVGACAKAVSMASPPTNPRRHISDLTSSVAANTPSQSSAPEHLFALTAALIVAVLVIGALLTRTIGTLRVRAHQRTLIDLIGEKRTDARGTFVLDHPVTTAFSVPGLRPRVVVSRGAVETLSADELAAVLAHERSHIHAHHDLVLLPFQSLGLALPRSRAIAAVNERISTLVEMVADDRATRQFGSSTLVRALCRMASSDEGPAVPVANPNGVVQRVERLLAPRPNPTAFVVGSGLSALLILALPLVTLFVSFGRVA